MVDPFYQQQEVSGLQEAYTIWNGIAVENRMQIAQDNSGTTKRPPLPSGNVKGR
jgi:hypothetical protein